jgi:hypothetical protein
MAEHQRLALWTPLRGAAVFRTVSSSMPDVLLKMVDEDGNAPSLTGCKPVVRLSHCKPFETGGPCGLCSRDPPLDKRALY